MLTQALREPACAADFERLSDANLELDVLGSASMFLDLLRFADRFPELRIVIDHLPFGQPPISELGRRPKVYAKVSGVLRRIAGRTPLDVEFYREALDELWLLFGPDRLVYGSNWPVLAYFTAKGRETPERYFWKNSLAAYRWERR